MTQKSSRLAFRTCLTATSFVGIGLLSGFSSRAPARPTLSVRTDSVGAPSPDSLAALFLHRFASGTVAEFENVDPDSESRNVMEAAAKKGLTREPNMGRVVERSPDRAVLLLAGIVKADNGGDETNLVRHFSGFYEAVNSGGRWTITRQIELDTLNNIQSQTIHAEIAPAHGMHVVDTLSVGVGAPYGIGFRLNNDVKLSSVKLDGAVATYEFGSGVLWIKAPVRKKVELVLDYTLDPSLRSAHDTAAKPAAPAIPPASAFHNTDVWHPFFGYNSGNDMAKFVVTATIPAEYYLTTTLPQTESVAMELEQSLAEVGIRNF